MGYVKVRDIPLLLLLIIIIIITEMIFMVLSSLD